MSHNETNYLGFVFLLILCIFFVTSIAVDVSDGIKTSRFDEAFQEGKISLDANLIDLDKQGFPAVSKFPESVPEGGLTLTNVPRIYDISGCEGHSLPENTKGVYASTTFFQNELIKVDVPQQPSGYLNVCVPEGTKIEVVLWANTDN